MFHHFPDELSGVTDYLVRSTDIEYKESSVASFVTSVSQAGYVQQTDRSYFRKALPKLEFEYTEARVDETVHAIDAESLKQLPYGLDGSRYEWIDLDSEGLSGVLTEQADAWYYKRNLGNGTFGAAELVAPRPVPSALSGATVARLGRRRPSGTGAVRRAYVTPTRFRNWTFNYCRSNKPCH